MSNYFFLKDGIISDTSIYGGSAPAMQSLSSTTSCTLLPGDNWSVGMPYAPFTTIDSIAVNLSSRDVTSTDVISGYITTYGGAISTVNTSVSYDTPFNTNVDGSIYFDGMKESCVIIPAGNNASLGGGDFTIEFWLKTHTLSSNPHLYTCGPNAANNLKIVGSNSSSTLTVVINTTVVIAGGVNVADNNWHHICVNRSAGAIRLYIDGNQSGATANSTVSFTSGIINGVRIGSYPTAGTAYTGFISNFRIVVGTAITPTPVPTQPLSIVPNTVFLYKIPYGKVYINSSFPGTSSLLVGTWPVSSFSIHNGSGNISSSSPNWQLLKLSPAFKANVEAIKFNLKVNNLNQLTLFGKDSSIERGAMTKINTLSLPYSPFDTNVDDALLFTGTDFLSTTAVIPAMSGDFTIELWFHTSSTINQYLLDGRLNGASTTPFAIATNITTTRDVGVYTGSWQAASSFLSGSWNHIAVSRAQGIISVYLNGSRISSFSNSAVWGGNTLEIGRSKSGVSIFRGLISNIRIIADQALYNGVDCVIPTSPLEALPSTTRFLYKEPYSFDYIYTDNTSNNELNGTLVKTGTLSLSTRSPFGSEVDNSVLFYGSDSIITTPDLPRMKGDFTIELWFHTSVVNYRPLIDGRINTGGVPYVVATSPTSAKTVGFYTGSWVEGGEFTLNSWNHVAVCRVGNTVSLYLNGERVKTAIHTAVWGGSNLVIGRDKNNVTFFKGLLSNIRIVAGQALYDGATYTIPTSPLSMLYGKNTYFLYNAPYDNSYTYNLPSNEIDYNRMLILSGIDCPSAPTLLKTGTLATPSSSPFGVGVDGVMLFTGTSHLSTTAVSAMSANFTIETWFYPAYNTATQTLIDARSSSSLNIPFFLSLNINTVGDIGVYTDGAFPSTAIIGNKSYNFNQWNHVAICRSGTTVSLYLNGERVHTRTNTSTWCGHPVHIGGDFANRRFIGLMSNVRFVAGQALYTNATYTVPTTPLPTLVSTRLLLKAPYNNTYIYTDNSTTNELKKEFVRVGTFPLSGLLDTSPFGSGEANSVYFNGLRDFIVTPTIPSMSGDFTVELWYQTGNPKIGTILDGRAVRATPTPFLLALNVTTAGTLAIYNGGAWVEVGKFNFYRWNHVAVCRSNGILSLYHNGSKMYSFAYTATWGGHSLDIGRHKDPAHYFIGSMSNIRIVADQALYSGESYTIPTAPLSPLISTRFFYKEPYSSNFIYTDNTSTNELSGELVVKTGSLTLPKNLSPFGTDSDSILFTGLDSISTTPMPAMSGDFTIELWFNQSDDGYNIQSLLDTRGFEGDQTQYMFTLYSHMKKLTFFTENSSNATYGTYDIGKWNHTAVCRSADSLSVYLNGSRIHTRTYSKVLSGNRLLIGTDASNRRFYGLMSNIRIVAGQSLYNGTTYVVPTSTLTAPLSTSFLYKNPYPNNFLYTTNTSTDELTGLLVKSGTLLPATITSPYGVDVDGFKYFNSITDEIITPPIPPMLGDFTIELWFYVKDGNQQQDTLSLIESRLSDNATSYFLYLNANARTVSFYTGDAGNASGTYNRNQWNHVAVCKNKNILSLYLNGTRIHTRTNQNPIGGGGRLIIGSDSPNRRFCGFMSNIRIVEGQALYNGTTYITPTSPLSALISTRFLYKAPYSLNYLYTNDTSNDELTGSLTRAGSLINSTSPFGVAGDSSILFNGTTDFIQTPAMPAMSGDFTIETWFYTNKTTAQPLIDGRNPASNTNPFLLLLNESVNANTPGTVQLYDGTGNQGYGTFYFNQWNHVAVSRFGSTVSLYLNGSLLNARDHSLAWSGYRILLGKDQNNRFFNGLMSNIRIVVGSALYTGSAYTVPDRPLNTALPTTPINQSGSYTSFLYEAPYSDSYLVNYPKKFHVSGIIENNTSVKRTVSATNDMIQSIYIHKDGILTFPNASTSLSCVGIEGIQVSSEGAMKIGSLDNPVPSNTTHQIILSSNHISIHNGGKLDIYGTPKLVSTNLTNDTPVSSVFVTVDDISAGNWSQGDIIVFRPNAVTKNGFDTLTLNALSSVNRFTTTTGSSYSHTGSAAVNINGVYNLSRNAIIRGSLSANSTLRTFDTGTANINYASLNSIDNSAYNNTTLSGSVVTIDNDFEIVSEYSNYHYFQGDIVTYPNSSALTLTACPYTIECWIRPAGIYSTTAPSTIFSKQSQTTVATSYAGILSANNGAIGFVCGSGGFTVYSKYSPPSNVWTHCAWVYDLSAINIYANGVRVLTAPLTSYDLDAPFCIGGRFITYEVYTGGIAGLKITKGVALYKNNFTPTISTLLPSNYHTTFLALNPNYYPSTSLSNLKDEINNVTPTLRFGKIPTLRAGTIFSDINNLTVDSCIFNRTSISLERLDSSNLNLTNNYVLSTGKAGIKISNISGNIKLENNSVVGSLSDGTTINNVTSPSIIGTFNYNSNGYGILITGENQATISGAAINGNKDGIFIDASTSNLSGISFRDITASNNSTLGIRISGNSYNPFTPISLNINRLIANNNKGGGIEGYSVTGNLSSLQLSGNSFYGIKTSIGNYNTTFDGITALMNNTSDTSAAIGILSATNYYPTLIKNARLGKSVGTSTFGAGIFLDSTKFSEFCVENSTISGGSSDIQIRTTRGPIEGSYLIRKTNIGALPFSSGINSSNYQSDVLKSTGFAFTNVNNTSGYHITYLAAGNRRVDTTINIDIGSTPSERLTPQSTTLKLRSGSKFVALKAGESVNVGVYVRKSSTTNGGAGNVYNGSAPRLILKRNAAMGIESDVVLSQLSTTSENFLKLSGVTQAVTDDGVLEFYVDCDGTQGWINLDNWIAS